MNRRSTVLVVLVVSLVGRAVWAQPGLPSATDPAPPPPPTPVTPPAAATTETPPPVLPAAPLEDPGQAKAEAKPEPETDTEPTTPKLRRNFAGSVQLDYMAIPSENTGRKIALDGATAEVSLKLTMEIHNKVTANVKMCVACHGIEVGMAYFDLRVADELNFRVGRFTPAFGEFPIRHDPANHRTSDKPLPYDMGRMVRVTEWNEGILPAPWVDNGLEINGTHFFGKHVQTDYAVYAIGGPRAGADPTDFDFKASRSGESYYVDNNSRPTIGGQLVLSVITDNMTISGGASMMRGTYDPDHRLPFSIAGAHLVVRARDVFFRVEYLIRNTTMSLGEDPAARFRYGPGADGIYDPIVVKDGAYAELEIPVTSRLTLLEREDGLRRRGNVVQGSEMRSDSAVIRHTAALAFTLYSALRLKLSYEYYDFSDFQDESVVHLGIAGPF